MISGLVFIQPGILSKIFGIELSSIEGAFWSLYVEVKFYIIFGSMYFLSKNKSVYVLTALYLFGFCYKAFSSNGFIEGNGFVENLLFSVLSLHHFGWFCIGVLLYLQKKNGGRVYITLSLLILFTILSRSFPSSIGEFLFGVAIYALFLGCLLFGSISRFVSNRYCFFLV